MNKSIFDAALVRKDFPCLNQYVHKKPLIYFDSAATAQKPQCVLDAMNQYYQTFASNINRGAHYLSEVATSHYHQARATTAHFINAHPDTMVFTRGTTESINLIAHCLGKMIFQPGDEIILSEMEHHSNIVPWYLLAQEKNLTIKVVPIKDDGTLDLDAFKNLFSPRVKLASFAHVSNALGIINPVKEMTALAHSFGAVVVIDGAQAIPHIPVDVSDIGADFYCFSGHKIYGPCGIGVLHAKTPWLDRMPPYQGGGDMIESVKFDAITFAKGPQKFEGGTPNIAGALGLAQALQYFSQFDHHALHDYEQSLLKHLVERLREFKHIKILGTSSEKIPLVSFIIDGIHPHDISSILDRHGIAIRAGHLCAEPLVKRFGVAALSRVSLAFYNTHDEIDQFIKSLAHVFEVFKI